MAGIAWYVLTAALTAGAFAAGWAAAGRNKRWALGAAAGALLVLILKAALNRYPIVEARLFPWTWYVYLQGYWLWPVTLLFFGLAVRQLPVRWNRAVVCGAAALMFACSLFSARWMVSPPDDSSQARADARGHCRQSTGYTCTPASCVSVLAWWGIEATEGEMARLCLTSSWGTTAFNAYRGLTLKLRSVTDADGRVLSRPCARETSPRAPSPPWHAVRPGEGRQAPAGSRLVVTRLPSPWSFSVFSVSLW